MNSKQNMVLWIGLIIIALNVASKMSEFKTVLFGGGSGSPKGQQNQAQASGGQNGIHIPGINITIPLAAQPPAPPGIQLALWQQRRKHTSQAAI